MYFWVKIWVWSVKSRQILIHDKSTRLEQTLNFPENAYIFNWSLSSGMNIVELGCRCGFSAFQVPKKNLFLASNLINLTLFSKWLRKSVKSLLYETKKLRNSEKNSEILSRLKSLGQTLGQTLRYFASPSLSIVAISIVAISIVAISLDSHFVRQPFR